MRYWMFSECDQEINNDHTKSRQWNNHPVF